MRVLGPANPVNVMSSAATLSNPAPHQRVGEHTGLKVGYLVFEADEALLQRAGCGAVRRETSIDGDVLTRLLAFLAPGDLLVLPTVRSLPRGYGGLERLLSELDARGLAAMFLAEALRTEGEEGLWLRRAVIAASELGTPAPRRRPSAAIRAKASEMRQAGASQGEIARTLRVSRMTVWRWLKAQP